MRLAVIIHIDDHLTPDLESLDLYFDNGFLVDPRNPRVLRTSGQVQAGSYVYSVWVPEAGLTPEFNYSDLKKGRPVIKRPGSGKPPRYVRLPDSHATVLNEKGHLNCVDITLMPVDLDEVTVVPTEDAPTL